MELFRRDDDADSAEQMGLEDVLDLHGFGCKFRLYLCRLRMPGVVVVILTYVKFSFVPVIYFYHPETSNISLEDIDCIFIKDGDEGYSNERSSTVAGDDAEQQRRQTETKKEVVEEREKV